jgi:hypothetical protein
VTQELKVPRARQVPSELPDLLGPRVLPAQPDVPDRLVLLARRVTRVKPNSGAQLADRRKCWNERRAAGVRTNQIYLLPRATDTYLAQERR